MYLKIVYVLMLHCMESTHPASHFGIWLIQTVQIEADINHFNILELGHIYISGCSQFRNWSELVSHACQVDRIRNSMAYRVTSALDFNKRGCVRQI